MKKILVILRNISLGIYLINLFIILLLTFLDKSINEVFMTIDDISFYTFLFLLFMKDLKIDFNEGTVDSGFELNYYKLTYRRRMIRSLYLLIILFIIGIFIFMYVLKENSYITIIIYSFLILLTLVQVLYNLIRWKQK